MPEDKGGSAAGGTGAGGTGAGGGTADQGAGSGVNPNDIAGGTGGGGTGTGAGSGAGGAGGAGGKDDEKFDAAYVKQLRDEAAKTRAELRKVQEALKGHEDAKLTDNELTAKRLKELEEENAALVAKTREADIFASAAKAGAQHPEVIAKLADPTAENLDAEVARLKKMYPTYFGKPSRGSADGGGGADPPPTKVDMTALIRAAAGRGPAAT